MNTAGTLRPAPAAGGGAHPGVSVVIEDYRPGTSLDDQLAELAYLVMHGWPDQRPVTAGLIRSRLDAEGRPSLVVCARDVQGLLVGAAALRPATPGGPGRLWGPGVDPSHRGKGLGRFLFDVLIVEATRRGHDWDHVTSAEVPLARTRSRSVFTTAGWIAAEELVLLRHALPLRGTPRARKSTHRHAVDMPPAVLGPGSVPGRITFIQPGNWPELEQMALALRPQLAQLYAACRPAAGSDVAQATLSRWSRDERFTPDCLTLAYRAPGIDEPFSQDVNAELLGAALVYPLTHTHPSEPPEALLADLLVRPEARSAPDPAALPHPDPQQSTQGRGSRDDLRRELALAALRGVADRHGARTARALVARTNTATLAALTSLGFTQPAKLLGHDGPLWTGEGGLLRTYRPSSAWIRHRAQPQPAGSPEPHSDRREPPAPEVCE